MKQDVQCCPVSQITATAPQSKSVLPHIDKKQLILSRQSRKDDGCAQTKFM